MSKKKKLTLLVMDAPYESANSTTAFRLIQAALEENIDVNVFAYEGAVSLAEKRQKSHENPVKGKTAEEEDHPNTKNWISSLFDFAGKKNVKLDWINCGLCLDERGTESIEGGPRRGGPKHFVEWVQAGGPVLVIPTR